MDQNQLAVVWYTESYAQIKLQLIGSIEKFTSVDYIDLTMAVEFENTDASLKDVVGCKVQLNQATSSLENVEAVDYYTTSSAYDELNDITADSDANWTISSYELFC